MGQSVGVSLVVNVTLQFILATIRYLSIPLLFLHSRMASLNGPMPDCILKHARIVHHQKPPMSRQPSRIPRTRLRPIT